MGKWTPNSQTEKLPNDETDDMSGFPKNTAVGLTRARQALWRKTALRNFPVSSNVMLVVWTGQSELDVWSGPDANREPAIVTDM